MIEEKYCKTQMLVEEFVKKILSGERDFTNITLPEGVDLSAHGAYPQIQAYLKQQDEKQSNEEKSGLAKNPFNFSYSNFEGLKAKKIYLPYLVAISTNFNHADLEESNLNCANLQEADFYNANLTRSKLNGINLYRGYLWGDHASAFQAECRFSELNEAIIQFLDSRKVNYSGSDFTGAFVSGMKVDQDTIFDFAVLKEVQGLDQVVGLPRASLYQISAGKKEQTILKQMFEENTFKPSSKKQILSIGDLLCKRVNSPSH